MDITATHSFPAPPPQRSGTLLMDPDAIKSCLPGCRELRPIGDNRYQAEITIGVAAVSGIVHGDGRRSRSRCRRSHTDFSVDATGKTGFAKRLADVVLKPCRIGNGRCEVTAIRAKSVASLRASASGSSKASPA